MNPVSRIFLLPGVLFFLVGCVSTSPILKFLTKSNEQPVSNSTSIKQDDKTILMRAEEGDADSQTLLGMMFYQDNNIEKNHEKAFKWWRSAAEKGNTTAQWRLATMYYNGVGVAQDRKKSIEWYKKSADAGDAFAQYNLAWIYYYDASTSTNYKKAVELWRKSAQQGNRSAQFNLGWAYYKGKGVKKDDQKAKNWFRIAAEQGGLDAKYNLKLLSSDKQVNKLLVLAPIQVRQPRQKFEGEIEKAKKAYKQKNYRLAHEHITPLVQDGNFEAPEEAAN